MKVILRKRVANLGQEWDIVNVKDGYARNYLIPQAIADVATPARIKAAEKHMSDRVKKMEDMVANAKEMVKKLSGVTLSFTKKARDEKLYGSIAEKDIVEALAKEEKLEITKEMVKMEEHLKTVGEHKVKIHLTEDADAEITVKIDAE